MRAARLALGVLGLAALGWGIVGFLGHAGDTRPLHAVGWLAAVLLAHDLVLAPLVAVGGWIIARAFRPSVRAVVHGGSLVAAVLLLLAVPVVVRAGAPAANATVLPRDYGSGTLAALAAVVTGTLAVAAWRSSWASSSN